MTLVNSNFNPQQNVLSAPQNVRKTNHVFQFTKDGHQVVDRIIKATENSLKTPQKTNFPWKRVAKYIAGVGIIGAATLLFLTLQQGKTALALYNNPATVSFPKAKRITFLLPTFSGAGFLRRRIHPINSTPASVQLLALPSPTPLLALPASDRLLVLPAEDLSPKIDGTNSTVSPPLTSTNAAPSNSRHEYSVLSLKGLGLGMFISTTTMLLLKCRQGITELGHIAPISACVFALLPSFCLPKYSFV